MDFWFQCLNWFIIRISWQQGINFPQIVSILSKKAINWWIIMKLTTWSFYHHYGLHFWSYFLVHKMGYSKITLPYKGIKGKNVFWLHRRFAHWISTCYALGHGFLHTFRSRTSLLKSYRHSLAISQWPSHCGAGNCT